MVEFDPEKADDAFPEHALRALVAATRHAIEAGHSRVIVRDGQLLEVTGDAVTVLDKVAPRKKTSVRTKFAPQ